MWKCGKGVDERTWEGGGVMRGNIDRRKKGHESGFHVTSIIVRWSLSDGHVAIS